MSEGSAGLKYALKTASGDFEKWVHLDPSTISNIADTSGAGDWLTASFLWFLLNKYPKVQSELHTNVIRQLLADAQDVAAQSCLYLGAQGIFSSAEGTSFLKTDLTEISVSFPNLYWVPVMNLCAKLPILPIIGISVWYRCTVSSAGETYFLVYFREIILCNTFDCTGTSFCTCIIEE